jgi:glutamyl-tRNA synthetase
MEKVIGLVKERCTLLTDFTEQARFFFHTPETWDVDAIKPKWNTDKQAFFLEVIRQMQLQTQWDAATLEAQFKSLAAASNIKPGEVLLPLRIMLVGGKYGPGVFDIAAIIGKEETTLRIQRVLELLQA